MVAQLGEGTERHKPLHRNRLRRTREGKGKRNPKPVTERNENTKAPPKTGPSQDKPLPKKRPQGNHWFPRLLATRRRPGVYGADAGRGRPGEPTGGRPVGLADQRGLEEGAEASARGAAGAIPALPHQDASAPPSLLKHLSAHLSMYITTHSPLPLTFF